jgi:hypothetical protein
VKTCTRWPRAAKAEWSVSAWRSMPPGDETEGHFREKTAILRETGEGLENAKGRVFHEKVMLRRSPVKSLVCLEKEGEGRGGWRRKKRKRESMRRKESKVPRDSMAEAGVVFLGRW